MFQENAFDTVRKIKKEEPKENPPDLHKLESLKPEKDGIEFINKIGFDHWAEFEKKKIELEKKHT